MKTLLIVESPAKARTITKYVSKDYVVIASYGHVWDLKISGKNRLGVDIEKNFDPKYEIIPDRKDKLRAIVKSATGVDQVYIASDPDREGEAIAWHLASTLKKTGLPIYRVLIHEYTKEEIKKALSKPGPLNADLYDAQQARRVLDRIVGFTVSPYLINNFGPNLSAGRVQSVAVRLIVDREREIEKFNAEEYYNINATFTKSGKKFTTKYTSKVTTKEEADKIKKDLSQDTFKISSVKESEKSKPAPAPLKTSTLTAAASSRYRFPAKKTMKAAQTLYENGFITYMRTDSLRLSKESVKLCRQFLDENNYDVPSKPNIFANKGGAQDGHEAIRPTDVSMLPEGIYVSEEEQKVYRLIWERFVACQMNPALYDSIDLSIKSSSGHKLEAAGSVLKYKGWLEISKDLGIKDTRLPPLSKGEVLDSPVVAVQKKATKPPSRYTEASLTKTLEAKEIGRPGTYVSILSKLTYRKYVESKGGKFYATEIGKQITDKLINHFKFMDYKYTAGMEKKLDQIASGSLGYADMLSTFYEPFKVQVKKAYLSSESDHGHKCPECGEGMLLKHGRLGYYLKCYDCTKTLSCDIIDDKPVIRKTDKPIVPGVKCPDCNAGMVEMPGKFGPFYSCSNYLKTRCKGTRKVPFGKKCPTCSDELYATIYADQDVLFCMNSDCFYREDLPSVYLVDPKKICDNNKIPKKIKKILSKVSS